MSCSPCSPSNKRCPYPPLRPRGFVPRPCPGRLVRAHASHAVENGMDSRMLDSRPSAMLLDRSGRGRGGRKRSSCSICLVRSSQVQVRPSSSSALMQHPGPSIHFKQPLCEGRVAADGPWGWENHGLSASQAEFRTILRTDKKPRTEPKLAPLRQPAKERPSSHKITEHIRQDLGSWAGCKLLLLLLGLLDIILCDGITQERARPEQYHSIAAAFPAANLRKIRLRRKTIALVLAQRLEENE